MGRMQREKGKRYERHIAAELRTFWPETIVRRASQAERADNPDVFIEGGPRLLSRLWLELHDARNPSPLSKLEQAERDVDAYQAGRRVGDRERLPVVIWHRIGERQSQVTTRLWVVDTIRRVSPSVGMQTVQMSFAHFTGLLFDAIANVPREVEVCGMHGNSCDCVEKRKAVRK